MKMTAIKFSRLFTILLTIVIISMLSQSCKSRVRKTRSFNIDEPIDTAHVIAYTAVKHPDWSKNLSIYEANIRQFTFGGTFKEFESVLPKIQQLGVGIIWLMPIHPIGKIKRKGTLGSYYSVQDYYGINPEFGSMDDFKRLVDEIHKLGMYVIIDWVANHTAWDNNLINEHPEWYTRDIERKFQSPVKDWSDVADLNYNHNKLQDYMIDAMKFWVETTDIDGFRCDVASMVPIEFWERSRQELDKVKAVFMLAEAENPEFHQRAFDMTYSWRVYKSLKSIAIGESGKYLQSLESVIDQDTTDYMIHSYRMQFTSNHDENSWQNSAVNIFGDALDVCTILNYTIPGMPLIYNGQEVGSKKMLKFFAKDIIDWKKSPYRQFYTKLNNLKRNNLAIWNGEYGGNFQRILNSRDNYVYTFKRRKIRDKVMVMANLSGEKQKFNLRLNIPNGEFTDIFTGEKVTFNNIDEFELGPWGYKVFEQKRN